MLKFASRYHEWLFGQLRRLYESWGFTGSLLYFIISFAIALILLFGGAIVSSLMFGESIGFALGVLLFIPYLILCAPTLFLSISLAVECMWKFFGIYRLFGVSGMPIRDKAFNKMGHLNDDWK